MATLARPLSVAILAVPEVTASTLFGMFDIFSSPGRDYQFITTGEAGEQRVLPYIVAREKNGFNATNGVPVSPHHDFASAPLPDLVCIPDFFVNPGESVAGKYEPEAAWLRAAHANGAILASACSGGILLGEAGFLNNSEATIHWGYAQSLTKHYGGVRVRLNQSLVLSGEAQRIVMAGGGTSWQDLALFLIARHVGLKEAVEVAKTYMLEWHELGQRPFVSLLSFKKSDDAVVNNCQEWIADNYRVHAPVAALISHSNLPERTFKRRFKAATGISPLDYVQALRLEEAKQMLETGNLAVEAIAQEVGYEDAAFFGRLFRKKVGITPARYRLRFGGLRRALGKEI